MDFDRHGAAHFPQAIPRARITGRDATAVASRCETTICVAEAGDIWAYATPILHMSERAMRPRRRRVLQIDYAGSDLPGGLDWASA